jgi:hypothetical protein
MVDAQFRPAPRVTACASKIGAKIANRRQLWAKPYQGTMGTVRAIRNRHAGLRPACTRANARRLTDVVDGRARFPNHVGKGLDVVEWQLP